MNAENFRIKIGAKNKIRITPIYENELISQKAIEKQKDGLRSVGRA